MGGLIGKLVHFFHIYPLSFFRLGFNSLTTLALNKVGIKSITDNAGN